MNIPSQTKSCGTKLLPKSYYWKRLVAAVAIILVCTLVASCAEPSRQELLARSVVTVGTPSGATNIKVINDTWYSFEYKGQCFLAMKFYRNSALTKIDCEDKIPVLVLREDSDES